MSIPVTTAPLGGTAIALPPLHPITFKINGVAKYLEVAPWTSILDLLREYLDLTGTKKKLRPRPVQRLYHPAQWHAH
jgi:xanthine dehydrogenase YagT iron-sulfur-binding subunit